MKALYIQTAETHNPTRGSVFDGKKSGAPSKRPEQGEGFSVLNSGLDRRRESVAHPYSAGSGSSLTHMKRIRCGFVPSSVVGDYARE
jgi:hypothetical protein